MPTTLPYYGGKHPRRKLNKWINSIIGPVTDVCYVEPFAGMLGVLMSRHPHQLEIVNDTSQFVVAWWKAMRDYPDEVLHKIRYTPFSRDVFKECSARIREGSTGDLIQDAWLLYVNVTMSMRHCLDNSPGSFSIKYRSSGSHSKIREEHLWAMHKRLEMVQIENRDCCELLDKIKDMKETLIYCDPPYLTADTKNYGKFELDRSLFKDMVLRQKGRVYISGYRDEWDDLDFHRYELDVKFQGIGTGLDEPRTEVLWSNTERTDYNMGLFD